MVTIHACAALFQMKDCGLMDVTVHYKTQHLEVGLRCNKYLFELGQQEWDECVQNKLFQICSKLKESLPSRCPNIEEKRLLSTIEHVFLHCLDLINVRGD